MFAIALALVLISTWSFSYAFIAINLWIWATAKAQGENLLNFSETVANNNPKKRQWNDAIVNKVDKTKTKTKKMFSFRIAKTVIIISSCATRKSIDIDDRLFCTYFLLHFVSTNAFSSACRWSCHFSVRCSASLFKLIGSLFLNDRWAVARVECGRRRRAIIFRVFNFFFLFHSSFVFIASSFERRQSQDVLFHFFLCRSTIVLLFSCCDSTIFHSTLIYGLPNLP